MSSNSKCWFIQVCLLVLFLSFFILDASKSFLWSLENDHLNDKNPFLQVNMPEKVTDKPFRLVEVQTIDDQMLENLSPALFVPVPVVISLKERNQIIKQNYNNAICFKQCHSSNDFSGGAYTVKQWRLLIEKDGHAVFCKIPWGNSHEKEKVFKYLLKTANSHRPDPEGIGIWE